MRWVNHVRTRRLGTRQPLRRELDHDAMPERAFTFYGTAKVDGRFREVVVHYRCGVPWRAELRTIPPFLAPYRLRHDKVRCMGYSLKGA